MPMTFIIGLLLLVAVLGAVGAGVWYFQQQSKQRLQAACRKAAEEVIQSWLPDAPSNSVYARWVDILKEQGYIEPLYANGSMLILGAPGMGLTEVMQQVVRHLNTCFAEERRMGVYLDARELTCVAPLTGDEQSVDNSFPEEIYRAIIVSLIDPLLEKLAEQMGENAFSKSGLQALDIELKDHLAANIIDMPVAAISQTMRQIWDTAGITQVKLCLDYAALVRCEHQAVLLSLLLRTFTHSRQGDLVIGGRMDELQLMSSTPQGPVGIQFGHDIFLSVNLEALLLPQADVFGIDLDGGPRADWLAAIFMEAGYAASLEDFKSSLFDPPESWKQLFHLHQGNLEMVAKAVAAAAAWKQAHPDDRLTVEALADLPA